MPWNLTEEELFARSPGDSALMTCIGRHGEECLGLLVSLDGSNFNFTGDVERPRKERACLKLAGLARQVPDYSTVSHRQKVRVQRCALRRLIKPAPPAEPHATERSPAPADTMLATMTSNWAVFRKSLAKREGALGQAAVPILRHAFLPFLLSFLFCHHFHRNSRGKVWLPESRIHRWVG